MTEELLRAYRPWLRKVAAGMTTDSRAGVGTAEDLAQEGWIALWRAWLVWKDESKDGAPLDWWLKKKAHGRMLTLVSRDWQTQKVRVAAGIPAGHPTVDSEAGTDDSSLGVWDQLLVDSAALLEGVDLAYHHGEIAAALDRLTDKQRQYVVLRFWHGYQTPDMIRVFGYDPRGIWKGARETLRSSLRHLNSATLEHTPEAGIGCVSVETGQG